MVRGSTDVEQAAAPEVPRRGPWGRGLATPAAACLTGACPSRLRGRAARRRPRTSPRVDDLAAAPVVDCRRASAFASAVRSYSLAREGVGLGGAVPRPLLAHPRDRARRATLVGDLQPRAMRPLRAARALETRSSRAREPRRARRSASRARGASRAKRARAGRSSRACARFVARPRRSDRVFPRARHSRCASRWPRGPEKRAAPCRACRAPRAFLRATCRARAHPHQERLLRARVGRRRRRRAGAPLG